MFLCVRSVLIEIITNIHPAYHLPRIYKMLEFFGLESGAFSQLTREYMINNFNPKTPDLPGVKLVNLSNEPYTS